METPQTKVSLNGWRLALDRAPMFLSVLLLFLLPFVTKTEGMDPLYPKQMLSQILVFFILCAWLLKIMLTGRLVWVRTTAFWPLVVFLGWIVLTLFFSPFSSVGWSVFSEWICYPLWYLLLTFTCFESWKAENLLIVFLLGGLGTSGWAIGQALGLDGGAWFVIVKNQFGGRVTAGLGNPDSLAGYLLLVWPIALALYLRAKQFLTRLIWSGLTVLSLIALLWTGSKAGLLGWAVGTMVYAVCYISRGGLEKSAKKILAVAAVTIIFLVLITPVSKRLQEILGSRNEALWFRTSVWKGAGEMVKGHPIKGTGFGTFEAAFPSYRPAGLMMRYSKQVYEVAHARNWLLEWTAETGLVGLALLILFWGFIFGQWWRLFSANAIPKTLGAGIFAAFAGVGTNNLFDLNDKLPAVLAPLLLLAALPVALSQRFYHLEGFPIRYREVELSRFRFYLLPLVIFSSFLAVHQVEMTVKKQLADFDLKKGTVSLSTGKVDEAIGFFDSALQFDPSCYKARYLRGISFFDRNKDGDLNKALLDLNQVGQVSPDYLLIHFKKYEILNQTGHPEEAKVELKRAIQLDPMLIYLLDDFKKARELTSGNRFSEAFIIYRNLYFDYPTCVPMMIDYANGLALAHDYPSAINLYHRVLELDPENNKTLNDLRKVSDVAKKVQDSKKKIFSSGL